MMKYFILLTIVISGLCCSSAFAQKYRLSASSVSFFSEAPMENIEAHNKNSRSIFDAQSGEVAFVIPIKGFEFEKSLMQEHFNENYLESDQYPYAKFEGKLEGYDPDKAEQEVSAQGEMTIHGVTHEIEISGTVKRDASGLHMEASFPISVADYDIEIPKIVFYNIAEVVEVNVSFQYQTHEP